MLTVAVLIDTFLIRTLVVPAIMSLAGRVNWYPGKVIEGTQGPFDEPAFLKSDPFF